MLLPGATVYDQAYPPNLGSDIFPALRVVRTVQVAVLVDGAGLMFHLSFRCWLSRHLRPTEF